MTTEHIDTEAFAFIARELTNHRPTEDTAEQVDGFTIAHGLDLREADEILGDPRPLRGGRIALWGAGAMVLFVLAVLAVAAELVRYWLP